MPIQLQIIWLFLLSAAVACIAWTVTHEELFKEPRDFCIKNSNMAKPYLKESFFTFLPVNIVSAITLQFYFCF